MVSTPERPSPNLPAAFEPGIYYEVTIWKAIEIAGRRHFPHERIIMKGSMAGQYKEAISSAVQERNSGLV